MLEMLSRLLCRYGLHDYKGFYMPAAPDAGIPVGGKAFYEYCSSCGNYRLLPKEH